MTTTLLIVVLLQLIMLGLLVAVFAGLQEGNKIMATNAEALAALTTQVAAVSGTVESTKVFIAGLEQQLRDNANDPAAITALADELATTSATLAAAIDNDPETT